MKTEKPTIKLAKRDGEWKTVSDASFLDAISGGGYSAMLNEINAQPTENHRRLCAFLF